MHPEDMGEGLGFGLFSLTHVYYLIACLIITIAICVWYKRASVDKRVSIRLFIGFIPILSQVIRKGLIIYQKGLMLEEIPLHLCGISVFFVAWYALKPSQKLGDGLFMLTLPGALVSLLFLDWSHSYQWNIYSIQSWVIHLFMVVYVVMLLWAKDLKPKVSSIPVVTGIFVVYSVFIYGLNKWWNTNYLYLNWPAPDSPIELFEGWLGNPGYVLIMALVLIVMWIVMYGLVYLIRWTRQKA